MFQFNSSNSGNGLYLKSTREVKTTKFKSEKFND